MAQTHDSTSAAQVNLEPTAANLAFVETLFAQWQDDPASVDAQWHSLFQAWRAEAESEPSAATLQIGPSAGPRSVFDAAGGSVVAPTGGDAVAKQHLVDIMIRNYRSFGHLASKLNPLQTDFAIPDELQPSFYGFDAEDMDRPFVHATTVPGEPVRTLRSIVDQMQQTYCGDIGVQFMHIEDLNTRRWLQWRMERSQNAMQLSRKEQIRVLTKLTDATLFEEFIQKKFIGAKSFSLEGGETLIPLLDLVFESAGESGVKEVVIGMAHRGRLNVLSNIMGKSPVKIFREFRDNDPESYIGGGDVKYHMGYSGDWRTRSGKDIHLSMCFNPSHLEYVNPVALGRTRAKQDLSGLDTRGNHGMTLLIHGDAAFAGEGIVQESLQLSELKGYRTGGTVHVIVNNQIGFTTNPSDSRSTRYCTDIAKMLQTPIFHVNGESPEAVAQAVSVAMDFRDRYKRDVIIDMYCFRKRGHNEGDEPRYTQPKMYEAIDNRPSVHRSYRERLIQTGQITEADANRIIEHRTQLLEKELTEADADSHVELPDAGHGLWEGYFGGRESNKHEVATSVPKDKLQALLQKQLELPGDFNLHPKHKRLWRIRSQVAEGSRPLDWGAAESLAFATLLEENHPIRITGQDAQRGTFAHRHAVLHDVENGGEHFPLKHLSENQASIDIFNSPLNEAGVLGFEYGYSLDMPHGLNIWEAQFGDFVNCAQVIIDQFITSAEDKWNRLSGLVMLLPHGFEGQGPEHSSARPERFLTACAEDNIQVCQPTTPAQIFHLLRRQVKRKWRKPLIVMSPKSLLRHPLVTSTYEELAEGEFQRVIPDATADPSKVKRVLLCSGRVYYDLFEKRQELERDDVAIVRLEQFYPFPHSELKAQLDAYVDATEAIWVQDEPMNQGGWPFMHMHFANKLGDHIDFQCVGRAASASPATGSKAAHKIEQDRLLTQAFA